MVVLLFEHRFIDAIMSGAKVHTIRQERKRYVRRGDVLSLRCWEGKAYRSKQRVLFEGPCLQTWLVTLTKRMAVLVPSHANAELVSFRREQLEAFARSDGFDTWRDMRHYWEAAGGLEYAHRLICWAPHPLLEAA